MSLATTVLLAFLPAIVRQKLEPEKSDRERELEGRVKELEAELDYVRLERDSARRRLEDAWDTTARLARERISERLNPLAQYQDGNGACQTAQYLQGQQLASYQHGLANHTLIPGGPFDCTGGGRSRHLAGALGVIGGA